MSEKLLPSQFSALEPFAATWCLSTERQRFAQRMSSSMDQMQAFYDAFFPRAEEAIEYCEKFPLDDMPDDAQRLLQLLYSLVMVSFPIEAWRQPHIPDSGAAYLDLLIEPTP
jgi:hypothetical protein